MTTKRKRRSMSLEALLVEYARCRDIQHASVQQMHYAIVTFAEYLECEPTTKHLTADNVNDFIAWMLGKTELARRTIKTKRAAIISLWREAWSLDIVKDEPKRIRKLRPEEDLIEALNEDEYVRLLDACDALRGRFRQNGVPVGPGLRAWLMVMYDTGLRPCDMADLKVLDLMGGAKFPVKQRKTRFIIWCNIRQETRDAIAATIPPERELFMPFARKSLAYWWNLLKDETGVRGTMKWIRRLGATQSELAMRGSAMHYLGHRTPGLAYRNYVDLSQLQDAKPLPPFLGGRRGKGVQ